MSQQEPNIDHWGHPRARYLYPVKGGYYVRLPAVAGGRQKWFGAKRLGGGAAAYAAALAWRDLRLPDSHAGRALRETSRPNQRAVSQGVRDRKQHTLGKSGVDLIKRPSDPTVLDVKASCRVASRGKTLVKTYPTDQHGLEAALRYALRARLGWERKHYAHYSRLTEDDWLRLILLCYEQFGPAKADLSMLKHPGAITSPDSGSMQARVMLRGVTQSAYFSFRAYSSMHETHAAAILWCIDNHARRKPGSRKRIRKASARNKTTGIAGVSRSVVKDRRGKLVVRYQASVKAAGSQRHMPMNFTAGRAATVTPEQEAWSLALATRCRQAYEACCDAGQDFVPAVARAKALMQMQTEAGANDAVSR